MDVNQRLTHLESVLELRYETLEAAEKRLAMTDEIFAKNAIKLRIREEILPEIHQCEREYWQLLVQASGAASVQEEEAQTVVVEVSQAVNAIQTTAPAHTPAELMQLLREIRDKLDKPKTPASAKAKLALPLVPGLLSYEVELDTEAALRRAFLPLKKLFKGAAEKK